MVPLLMTLSDLRLRFQGHNIFEVEYRKTARLKDKVLLHNRKLYLTYGMVLFVWWPWQTSKRVMWVCQHQLSFLL